MKLLFVTVVVFVMVSVAFAVEESPNPSPSPGKERQPVQKSSTDEDQETRPPNATSKNLSAPNDPQLSAVVGKPDIQNPGNQPCQCASDSWAWGWMTLFTLALIVVGGFQAYIYNRQAELMTEGLRLNRQSAQAARDGAAAAMKSAEVAETALKLTQRAYVIAEKWELRVNEMQQVIGLT